MVTRLALLVALLALLLPRAALAAESEPVRAETLVTRLITAEDGVAPRAGRLSAGLHVDLAEGWKTYWRSPGEVGLPPEIDWGASRNVADVAMLWPAPTRFQAFGIENFGYGGEVLFPLLVTLERPGEPRAAGDRGQAAGVLRHLCARDRRARARPAARLGRGPRGRGGDRVVGRARA